MAAEDASTTTDTQAAPRLAGDTAPAEIEEGIDIAEDEEVETPAPKTAPEDEGEPEADTPDKSGPPAKPKAPETPAFDPAEYGLDESYAHCKTVGEAMRLVESRRKQAEAKIAEQGRELGELRKAKPPEKPAEDAKPVEWTEDQAAEWQRLNDEKPWEAEAYRIQQTHATLLPVIEAAKAEIRAEVKAEIEAMRGQVRAPVIQKAAEEVEAFFAENEGSRAYEPKMLDVYNRLNEGRPDTNRFPVIEADLLGLARLEETDPAAFQEVFELVSTGKIRFEKALKVVKGSTEVSNTAALGARTKVRAAAAAGKGSSGPPPEDYGIDIGEDEE